MFSKPILRLTIIVVFHRICRLSMGSALTVSRILLKDIRIGRGLEGLVNLRDDPQGLELKYSARL